MTEAKPPFQTVTPAIPALTVSDNYRRPALSNAVFLPLTGANDTLIIRVIVIHEYRQRWEALMLETEKWDRLRRDVDTMRSGRPAVRQP